MRLFTITATALLLGLLSTGCVYRMDIRQGNQFEQDALEQVKPGTTRNQVRFLLGTPMLADPFHPDRWDYVYYFRDGKTRKKVVRKLTVFFDGDVVERVENPEP